jgi:hypothetical protein
VQVFYHRTRKVEEVMLGAQVVLVRDPNLAAGCLQD